MNILWSMNVTHHRPQKTTNLQDWSIKTNIKHSVIAATSHEIDSSRYPEDTMLQMSPTWKSPKIIKMNYFALLCSTKLTQTRQALFASCLCLSQKHSTNILVVSHHPLIHRRGWLKLCFSLIRLIVPRELQALFDALPETDMYLCLCLFAEWDDSSQPHWLQLPVEFVGSIRFWDLRLIVNEF